MGLVLVIVLVVVAIALYGLHRLAVLADGRGWVFYRTKPKYRGSSLGLIEEMYHPAHEHVIDEETSEQERADVDEAGEGHPSEEGL